MTIIYRECITPALRTRAISIPISYEMQKIAKSLESAFAWSRSLLCRIVVKLHFQLFNNVDIFSQRVAFSQEDMSKQKRLTGSMQELAVELLFSVSKTKGQFSY